MPILKKKKKHFFLDNPIKYKYNKDSKRRIYEKSNVYVHQSTDCFGCLFV